MFIVFIHPPGIAHANEQIPFQENKYVIFPCRIENLSMARIMSKKANLPEDKGQEHSIHHTQQKIVYYEEEDYAQNQHSHCEQYLICVIFRLFFQQTSLFNNIFQCSVLIRSCAAGWTINFKAQSGYRLTPQRRCLHSFRTPYLTFSKDFFYFF